MELDSLDLIVAVARDGVIGQSTASLGLPWHIPEDLKHFRRVTLGRPVIMGRHTFEAIGRPLPKRTNIVLSRTLDDKIPGVLVARSLAAGLKIARRFGDPVIAGGAKVYEESLPLTTRVFLTKVDRDVVGDVFFPRYEQLYDNFVEVSAEAASTEPDVSFHIFERGAAIDPSKTRC